MKRSYGFILFPAAGALFCLWYVCSATSDVVYSDYIRLINSYLPDVWNPEKFFVPDILTRIPINFLSRGINTNLFHFSVRFDQILGILGLGLAAQVTGIYVIKERLGFGALLAVMLLMFSLNKWEMLTNGTGWCHFLAFVGFYFHYRVFDRVWRRGQSSWEGGRIKGVKKDYSRKGKIAEEEELAEEKEAVGGKEITKDKRDRMLLKALPWAITLGTAGPYCGSYCAVLLLTYGICFVLDRKRAGKGQWDFRYLAYGFHVVCPLILYLISNSFAVTEHAGTTGRTIGQVLGDNLSLFPKFIIKSLSSMVVGEEVMMEQLEKLNMGMALCYLAGALVLAGYLLALWMQLRERLYQVSVFPLMLIFAGGLNHLLVLAARWIFENSSYGMSSRYALQYQAGILGVVLTFGLFYQVRQRKEGGSFWTVSAKWAALSISLAILAGNGYTTVKELEKAPHRKAYGMKVAEAALNYREVADDELEALFQYHHGPEKIRNALRILEENGWNVYRGR